MYRITFTSVVGGGSRDDLQVIEIRVSSGDRNELYQDEFHEVGIKWRVENCTHDAVLTLLMFVKVIVHKRCSQMNTKVLDE